MSLFEYFGLFVFIIMYVIFIVWAYKDLKKVSINKAKNDISLINIKKVFNDLGDVHDKKEDSLSNVIYINRRKK